MSVNEDQAKGGRVDQRPQRPAVVAEPAVDDRASGHRGSVLTGPLNATLIDRRDLHEELSILRVRRDDGRQPDFEPGQFITIGLPKPDASGVPGIPGAEAGPSPARPQLIRRAYSIASSPRQRDDLELFVVLVRDGRLTPGLWDLQPGDRLWVDHQARGEFTLRGVPDGRDLVMISTGTGLAPFMSMLRTYRGSRRWRRFVVIHGGRFAKDLGYRRELEQASAEDPSVVYLPTVTREPAASAWTGLRGRVHRVIEGRTYHRLAGAPLDPEHSHVFLCGNPAMIRQVQADLEARGFVTQTRQQPGNIHVERYW